VLKLRIGSIVVRYDDTFAIIASNMAMDETITIYIYIRTYAAADQNPGFFSTLESAILKRISSTSPHGRRHLHNVIDRAGTPAHTTSCSYRFNVKSNALNQTRIIFFEFDEWYAGIRSVILEECCIITISI